MPSPFVGRDDLVAEMVERLVSGNSLALSAEGMPGVGKTTMAVALAHHRAVLRHFKDGVLWTGLGVEPDAMSALATWAEALEKDVSSEVDEAKRALAVRNVIGQRHLLLVIDDAWQIEPAKLLRCGGPNCCHLLTTRDEKLARDFAGGAAQVESLPELPEDRAFELLHALALEACEADPAAARALVSAVGGLPLAIELLGGYLAAPERSYFRELSAEALTEMADPRQRLKLATQRLGTHERKEVTLQETIALSLEGLPEPAVQAFHALGAFAPKPETFDLAAAKAVTGANAAALAVLSARNLVERGDGEQLSLHQTLADVARTQTDREAVERHRDYYLSVVNADREDWRAIEAVYGQIKWVWTAVSNTRWVFDLITALSAYQELRGLWHDQLNWEEQALLVARAQAGHREVGVLLNNIGLHYDRIGRRHEALEYYQKALAIHEELGDKWGVAVLLHNLGLIYDNIGQHQQALGYYQRAVPIRKEVGDRAGLAVTLNNLGRVYYKLGQYEEALEYLQEALPIRSEVGDQRGVAITLNNIGSAHFVLGQHHRALEYFREARIIQEDLVDRWGLAVTLINSGRLYYESGQLHQALEDLQKAAAIHEEVGDLEALATALNHIGRVYAAQGQRQKALEYYEQALPIQEEVGDRAGEAVTRFKIAMVYRQEGRLAEAVAQLRRVVELDELVQHPDLEQDRATLAEVEAELAAESR